MQQLLLSFACYRLELPALHQRQGRPPALINRPYHLLVKQSLLNALCTLRLRRDWSSVVRANKASMTFGIASTCTAAMVHVRLAAVNRTWSSLQNCTAAKALVEIASINCTWSSLRSCTATMALAKFTSVSHTWSS